jgi:hypothetical protein
MANEVNGCPSLGGGCSAEKRGSSRGPPELGRHVPHDDQAVSWEVKIFAAR